MLNLLWICILLGAHSATVPESTSWGLDFSYHDDQALEAFLKEAVQLFPSLATLYSIGQSSYGTELWVLMLKSPYSSSIGTPHVKLIGNIHGNEPAGREVLLHFIEYILNGHSDDEDAQILLNNTVLHILPSLNPDGFSDSREGDCSTGPGRNNGNSVDLNRNFPDQFRIKAKSLQPETEAVINWLKSNQFVLSASIHGGALVANYPLDSTPGEGTGDVGNSINERALTPDDDVFKDLARTYADSHPVMHEGRPCANTPSFPGGITNGASWYILRGGMQDFNYLQHGCMELTLEISCCKYPTATHLPKIWRDNKQALVNLVKKSHHGVRGIVLNPITNEPVTGVELSIAGRNITFSTSKHGEFWRILLPGKYTLQVRASGYAEQHIPFSVRNLSSNELSSTWLPVYLRPRLLAARTFGFSSQDRILPKKLSSLHLFVFIATISSSYIQDTYY